MASTQDIRRRIKSVKNIQQITKAMKMVAAARLRKAQEKASVNEPYTNKMKQVLADVAGNAGSVVEHPLLTVRPVQKTVYVVVGPDKGLAGAYASNVFKETVAKIEAKESTDIIAIGRKTKDYFGKRGYNVISSYENFSEKPSYDKAREISRQLMQLFTDTACDEIYMVYTRFVSAIQVVPTTVKLLPLTNLEENKSLASGTEYIYEPSAAEVLGYLLPQYFETMVYGALLQAAASELGSRMTAMSSATDNAEELINKLILNYNKVRQASITSEISEIVSGAEALK